MCVCVCVCVYTHKEHNTESYNTVRSVHIRACIKCRIITYKTDRKDKICPE